MFTVRPRLAREVARAFKFVNLTKGEEQCDYSIQNGNTLEIPFSEAIPLADKRKRVTKANPGDVLTLTPKVAMLVQNRIVIVEVCPELYQYGKPSFKKMYRHGDTLNGAVTFECLEPVDFKALPYLFEVYIVDEVIR